MSESSSGRPQPHMPKLSIRCSRRPESDPPSRGLSGLIRIREWRADLRLSMGRSPPLCGWAVHDKFNSVAAGRAPVALEAVAELVLAVLYSLRLQAVARSSSALTPLSCRAPSRQSLISFISASRSYRLCCSYTAWAEKCGSTGGAPTQCLRLVCLHRLSYKWAWE